MAIPSLLKQCHIVGKVQQCYIVGKAQGLRTNYWVSSLGLREMCSTYLPAEHVYPYLNCFQRLPGNSCELAAVLDGLFLKMESIRVMFIGKFKLPAYDSSIYIFWGFVIPCRV